MSDLLVCVPDLYFQDFHSAFCPLPCVLKQWSLEDLLSIHYILYENIGHIYKEYLKTEKDKHSN